MQAMAALLRDGKTMSDKTVLGIALRGLRLHTDGSRANIAKLGEL
jgi:hypothetical protein